MRLSILPKLPKRILIQGGGYIAVEFASIFAGLGSEVTLVYRGENILRGFDDDVREHLRSEMRGRGITVNCGQTVTAIEKIRRRIRHAAVRQQHNHGRQGHVRDRSSPECDEAGN